MAFEWPKCQCKIENWLIDLMSRQMQAHAEPKAHHTFTKNVSLKNNLLQSREGKKDRVPASVFKALDDCVGG
jgi:hypothetical protein